MGFVAGYFEEGSGCIAFPLGRICVIYVVAKYQTREEPSPISKAEGDGDRLVVIVNRRS
jgi:hypothetical protein